MPPFLQFVIDVLSLGSAYALMALGLVIVYGILRLVNFAYGELIMVVGYTLFLLKGSPLPWLVMAAAGVLMAILTGILTDYAAFRPVREKSVTAVLITSFAFSTLLQNAALLFISPRPRNVPVPDIFSETVEFAGVIAPMRNLLTIVLALGLQVFMGNSGILSFAHIGFMGVGAYASGVLSMPAQMKGMALPDLYPILQGIQLSPYVSIFAAGLVAAGVAAAVAYPLMRLSDAAAVITSFALLVVLHTIMVHWSAVTNGPRTFCGVPKATDLPLAAGFAIGAMGLALMFKESRTGLLLRAVRDDEAAAEATGAHVSVLRWRGFVLSALMAGFGGALWGHFITSFSPKAFYLKETFVILGMLVIGGPSTVSGAVLGVFLVTFSFEGLRALESAINLADVFPRPVVGLTEVALACGMILLLVLRPGGIFANAEIGALILAGRGRERGVRRDIED